MTNQVQPLPQQLERTIGVFGLACSVVNITVGTGIFVLPALAAEHLGAAAIICLFICGAMIFLIALCFAEVGSKVTSTGGTYAYIETAFGPFAGFLANNIFWLSCCLSDAAVANGLLKTVGYFYPVVEGTLRPFILFALFAGFTWINIRGAKSGLRMVIFTTIAKLIPLLLVVLFGLGKISMENLAWKGSFGMAEIGAGTLVFFYAFLGIETSVSNSGEFKNPARVVPLGILSGLSLVLMIYLLIQLVTQGILGDELQMHKDAPLAEVSNRLFGALGIVLVTIGAAVAMLGNLSGEIFSIPRIFFAGARDGIFPMFFGKVHPRFVTPARAIILYSSIDFIFALFGGLRQLLILSTATTLLIYLGVVLAVIRLRKIMPMASGTGFRVPGGMVVPIITSIAILWLFFTLTWKELAGMALLLCLLSVVYLVVRFRLRKMNQQS